MFEQIKEIFAKEGIRQIGIIGIEHCDIINPRILPSDAKSAIMFSIPYRSLYEHENDGISEYARIYDYHQYSDSLYKRIISLLQDATGYSFYGFCDHSPINEKLAIAKCGFGFIGRNSLFFDDKYGSFVFIGSLITNMHTNNSPFDIKKCENCGKCIKACPNSAITETGIDRQRCLSAISQKKNKTDEEKLLLKKCNIVWGCDICQKVCPHNSTCAVSPIDYFEKSRVIKIDKDFITNLSDEDFNKFAFAYKGRKLILDNIDFI